MSGTDPAVSDEYASFIPPDAEFEVRRNEHAGRFMMATASMPANHDFLIEAPLVAWPLVSDWLLAQPKGFCPMLDLGDWCESCLGPLKDRTHILTRTVRRRVSCKRAPLPGEQAFGPLCQSCSERLQPHRFLTAEVLWRWRLWQTERSPRSQVGLEAFGRCFAQVAATAAQARSELGLEADEALEIGLRPFLRLQPPPLGGSVTLHGTSAAEVAKELAGSESFVAAIVAAVGSQTAASRLLSEASVNDLAGRLLLNAVAIEIPDAAVDSEPLRAAGIFVLLSTMNHSCDATVKVDVESGSSDATLRTTRAVEAGELLTLAYVSRDLPLQVRRETLSHWFFECDCVVCESEAMITAALA